MVCFSDSVYGEGRNQLVKRTFAKILLSKKSLFHYWHMAETNYREYLKDDEVRVKKYFYVLRPLMAAKWILDKKCAPPMLFDDLVEAELEDELRPELTRLLELKKSLPEMGIAPKIQIINDHIEKVMPEIKGIAKSMVDKEQEWKDLNQLFLKMVKE